MNKNNGECDMEIFDSEVRRITWDIVKLVAIIGFIVIVFSV